MKKLSKIFIAAGVVLSLSSCIVWAGHGIASNDDFESNNGIYNIQEPNYTVDQLYAATIKYLEAHPDDYKIQAKNEGETKAQIYAYSYPDRTQLQFYIVSSQGMTLFGVKIGNDESIAKTNPERVKELEQQVLLNVQK